MKKTVVRSLILILSLILTLSFVMAFSACNKNKKPTPPDTSREDARDAFVKIVMLARDDAWYADLADEELAVIDNAGDYIVALNWTTFVANVLYDSSLQTGKIKKINEVLSSDKGKEVIKNIEKQQYDYVPLLKDMGLTEEDIQEVAFAGIIGVFEKSVDIFDACINRSDNVKLISQKGTARDNLDNVIASSKRSKDAMMSADVAELKNTIYGVEDGIKSIIGFAYNTVLLFDGEGESSLIKMLTSGALEGATASELAIYLESAFDSVDELKAQLTNDNISKISNALGQIIDKMEGVTVTSEMFSSIIGTMRYVYAFFDFLPYACDYVENIGDYLTSKNNEYSNLQSVLSAAFDEEYIDYDEYGNVKSNKFNLFVPISQAVMSMFDVDYSFDDSYISTKAVAKQQLIDMLSSLGASAKNDYKKSVVLIYINFLLNGEEGMTQEDIEIISGIVVADATIGSFRNAYAKYA
ncbi:MAG: hypothetical protein MJ193_01385, partial [Clostridia bacterium]|nr:hypothetical protein [Clostridia bacterium]